MYDRLIDGIDDSDHEYVIRTLKWLVGSKRSLSLKELAEAVAIDLYHSSFNSRARLFRQEDIINTCGSLVRMDNDVVVLSHFSIKEYLLSSYTSRKAQDLLKFTLEETNCRHHILMSMISYIFSVGLRLRLLEPDVLVEIELPLTTYIMEEKVLDRRFIVDEDMRTEQAWIERMVSIDGLESTLWISLANYSRPLLLYPEYYSLGTFIHRVVLLSLMNFIDSEITSTSSSHPNTSNKHPFKVIAD